MEHIIEMKQEVVEKLMKTTYTSKDLRAPFRKFTLTFPNSVFVTKEQVMADVLETMLKTKGVTNAVLSPKEKARLEKMARQYSDGLCNLKVKCIEDSELLEFSAILLDPMGSVLIDFKTSAQFPIPLISKNEFSNTPLVTANALTNLIVGVIEYLNSPSQVIAKREVKEPVTNKGSKSKKSKNKNKKTYIHKCYYSVDKIDTASKRSYERHTESWTSRGHWRTYKSGKRVWIKEQVRGRGKDNLQSKSYKINKLDK